MTKFTGMARRPGRHRAIVTWGAAALVGASLVMAPPAHAFTFASVSPSFPSSVTVGETITASVALGNFSTPPESISNPVLTASDIDLYPACATTVVDCAAGVDAGVYKTVTGTGVGTGGVTCAGTWTVTEASPGRFRLNPPAGNGSLLLGNSETCIVDFSLLVMKVPTIDVDPAPGVQTRSLVSATFSAPTVAPFRNTGSTTSTGIPAPVAPPSDFDGDGDTDPAVYRPSNRVWYSPGSSVAWGAAGDIPVPGDYDGDGQTDQAVYRPLSGVWYVNGSFLGATADAWGVSTDIPVPGDYDGDNKTDRAVYRPSTGEWFVSRSSGGASAVAWGIPSDIPVPGDYDGDGQVDRAVFRPSSGVWFVQRSSGGTTSTGWGVTGDVPVPADYDGDGRTDQAVYRPPGVWYVLGSGGGATSTAWGAAGDIPVPGQYDSDDKADRAVFRPSLNVWFVQLTGGGAISPAWGASGDIPLALPTAIGRSFFTPPFS